MPESGLSGSVRGVPSNGHPYRDPGPEAEVETSAPRPREVAASAGAPGCWRGSTRERRGLLTLAATRADGGGAEVALKRIGIPDGARIPHDLKTGAVRPPHQLAAPI